MGFVKRKLGLWLTIPAPVTAQRRHQRRHRDGVALLIVIVFILLLSIAGGAILMLISSRYKLTKHQVDRTKAFNLAEAGMYHALWRIRNNANGPPPSGEPNLCDSSSPDTETLNIGSSVVSIEYTKTEEGGDLNKSSDDKFEIKSRIVY